MITRRIAEVIRDLQRVNFNDDDYMSRLEDLSSELEFATDRALAMRSVFEFIEQHPMEDLGAPGPLVHSLERLPRREYQDEIGCVVV